MLGGGFPREPAFFPRAELIAPRLSDLSKLDDADFRKLFSGSPIKRTGRDRFTRNVLIALANSGEKAAVEAVQARLDDSSPVVAKTAKWALKKLNKEP